MLSSTRSILIFFTFGVENWRRRNGSLLNPLKIGRERLLNMVLNFQLMKVRENSCSFPIVLFTFPSSGHYIIEDYF